MNRLPENTAGDSSLEQLVVNLMEGVILADRQGTMLFANEAALSLHDCRSLAGLGRDVEGYRQRFTLHYRNNHQLAPAQYPLARLAAGTPFREMTVTVTPAGQLAAKDGFRRVLRIRGLLLAEDAGKANMTALILRDLTGEMDAEERFERSFASNPAPAAILRIEDSRFIKANQGFLDMTGCKSDEVIGHAFHEIDVLAGAEHREAALAALREHRTIPQQEAVITVRTGRRKGREQKRAARKFVIVAGQPIEIGESGCMLFTFNDLDLRKQTEESLRQSRETFSRAFHLAPLPMLICAPDRWRIREANAAFLQMVGKPAEEVIGTPFSRFRARPGKSAPIAAPLECPMQKREVRLLDSNGTPVDSVISTEEILVAGEPCVLCVLQDDTEHKRSEADLTEAINTVMQDTSWFTRTLLEKLASIRQGSHRNPDSTLESLTPREREILEKACHGETNAEIAAALSLSKNTVRNHIANIYSKIGVNRRSDAIIWGRERGLASY